ncbi:hypothetical protein [Streptomyces himalayensis]|uniref:Uncharacterized protein n=1 Tax=Streptomyces himalayensis subsp. himalayensis TaxID=2756131 RepID=A0A7W0DQW2_9ACTN|nr:hypothetical protein [Streptomyces himalayensis]MBA2949597.1 hypothetical protein [Streptomyces himalayensis subsp. himalayensis]
MAASQSPVEVSSQAPTQDPEPDPGGGDGSGTSNGETDGTDRQPGTGEDPHVTGQAPGTGQDPGTGQTDRQPGTGQTDPGTGTGQIDPQHQGTGQTDPGTGTGQTDPQQQGTGQTQQQQQGTGTNHPRTDTGRQPRPNLTPPTTKNPSGQTKVPPKPLTPVQQQALKCGAAAIGKIPQVVKVAGLTLKMVKGFTAGYAVGEDLNTGDQYNVWWDSAELLDLALPVPAVTCLRVLDKIHEEEGKKAVAPYEKDPSKLGVKEDTPVKTPEDPALQQKDGAYTGSGG